MGSTTLSQLFFSLLDGLSRPSQIAERCLELGYEACALTDHGSVSGVPALFKECKKRNLKAIAGCEFYLCRQDAAVRTVENGPLSHLCVLAKNERGWKNMMRASSASYKPEFSYRKPRLDLERLGRFAEGEFIVFSGHMGSDLANICFEEPKKAYRAETYEAARSLVAKDWEDRVNAEITRYQKAFGKENFYLEIQLIDAENLPAALVVARILRHVGRKRGVPRVATADSHYCRREDAPDQRILLCSAFETTLRQVQAKMDDGEDVTLGAFFRSSNYHIPSLAEMKAIHEPDELAGAVEIAGRCDAYGMGGKTMMPAFDCPDGLSQDGYFRQLCETGWKREIAGKNLDQNVYRQRLESELEILMGAGLSSYFLIVQDYVNYAKKKLKCRVGRGRGSGAGCLASLLSDITDVDPIRFGLLFSRFYNHGRNTADRVSLPDIDSDFPISYRGAVIDYIRKKYGEDKVCQMATFSRMQGRGALKDVLRAWGETTYEEMNLITEHIPDEAEISDQLQLMREETGEASIIQWALENNPEPLKQWCWKTETGELEGPLAPRFAQAIRLEGTKRSMGKHASGIIISSVPLADVCPMVYDKGSKQLMIAVDMRDAEDMGFVKYDILGTAVLDKIMGAENIIRNGRI